MFHLAVIATTLTCPDAIALVDKMQEYKVEEDLRAEMIQIVKVEMTDEGCDWDAKAD